MDNLTDQVNFDDLYQNHVAWWDKLIKRPLSSANVFLSRFNGFDIFPTDGKSTNKHHKDEGDKRQKRDYLQLIERYVYCYLILRVMLNCTLQYIYDFHQFDLRILRNEANTTSNRSIHEERISQLEQQIRSDKSLIKLFGSPYMNLSFLIEVFYIHLIWFTFSSHIQPQIYWRLVEPLNFTLLRVLADRPRELNDCKRIVAAEMERFMASSRNFSLAKAADPRLRSKDLFIHQIELTRFNCKESSRESVGHDLIVKLLKQLASGGFLTPLNRTCKWLNSICRLAATLQGSFFIFCIVYIYFLAFYLTSSESWLGHLKVETDFMDNVMRIELLTLCCIAMLATLFYATMVSLTTLDQTYYLLSLRSLAQDCTSMIARVIELINDQKIAAQATNLSHPIIIRSRNRSRSNIEPLLVRRDLMNEKILRFLIQYRILTRQSRSQKNSCGLIIFIALQVVLLAALLAFFHAPAYKEEMIFVMFVGTGLFLLWLNIFIMPTCYMHCRGADIYRCMSKLLGASDSLRHHYRDDKGRELSNRHLIWCLRRELQIPQTMVDQFTFKVLGIPFTYENMLRADYWCSLLLLFAFAVYKASGSAGNSNTSLTSSFLVL